MAAQNDFEMFVFQIGQRFQASDFRVDAGGWGEGGTRELPVLRPAGAARLLEKLLVAQASLFRVFGHDAIWQRPVVGELNAVAGRT